MARKFELLLSVLLFLFLISHAQGYKLKQVLILSRHNIRTPLIENLQYASTNEFPKWDQNAGELTGKGALLEECMAEYFHKWFVKHKLLPEGCPDDKLIHIYANTRQRTRESAKAFARAAFRNCNVTVFSIDSDDMDPVFNPVPRNTSEELKSVIVDEMQQKLSDMQIQDAYKELSNILNLKGSKLCKVQRVCDFANQKNDILYKIGIEPDIVGPLHLGNAIVDSFLMRYYEGKPLESVAWGKIKTPEQWKLLTKITKENQNVRFNSTILAREVARPLLTYMLGIFERKSPPKLTVLVGHDSNLNPVMASLNFIARDLPGQYESTPVGGKLIFQKWINDAGKEFLRVDFVYQTFEQLRNGTKLSMDNPPQWVKMQINNCADEHGYCLWESFLNSLRSIVL